MFAHSEQSPFCSALTPSSRPSALRLLRAVALLLCANSEQSPFCSALTPSSRPSALRLLRAAALLLCAHSEQSPFCSAPTLSSRPSALLGARALGWARRTSPHTVPPWQTRESPRHAPRPARRPSHSSDSTPDFSTKRFVRPDGTYNAYSRHKCWLGL
jgi:CDGSH-type Zn-finger protein